jgi:hypothetical protein
MTGKKRKVDQEQQSFPLNATEIIATISCDKTKQSKGFCNFSSLVHSDEPYDLSSARQGNTIILTIKAPKLDQVFNSLVFFKPSIVKSISCQVSSFVGFTDIEPKIYVIPKNVKEGFFAKLWKEQCEKDLKSWKENVAKPLEKENVKRVKVKHFNAFDPKTALTEFNPNNFNFSTTETVYEPNMFGKVRQGNAREMLRVHTRRSKRLLERKK